MNRDQRRRLKRVQLAEGIRQLGRLPQDERVRVGHAMASVIPVETREAIDKISALVEERGQQAAKDLDWNSYHKPPTPMVAEKVDWVFAGILSGDIKTCPHITSGTVRPMFISLWDEFVHCGCHDATLTDPIKNFTCDFCGEYHQDDCRAHLVVIGPMTVSFGMCTECETKDT